MSELDLLLQINNLAARLQDLERHEKRAIACRVYNSGTFTHNSSGNWLAVTFDSDRVDALDMHSTVTNTSRVTVPVAGWYLITGTFAFATNNTGTRRIGLRINGSNFITIFTKDALAASSLDQDMSIATLYYLSATNYVELMASQSSGGSLNIINKDLCSPELAVIRLP